MPDPFEFENMSYELADEEFTVDAMFSFVKDFNDGSFA
jgi:hypothetical protein